MPQYLIHSIKIVAGLLALAVLWGCAESRVAPGSGFPQANLASLPPPTGPPITVAVLPFGLSDRAAARYPHLLDSSVGFGVHNLVMDALFRTNRFRIVEQNPEIMEDIIERQWMSSSGIVGQAQAIQIGRMLGAEKVIYGEIYDYAQGGEQVSGFQTRKGYYTRVGVQVICTDVETAERVAIGTADATADDYGQASRQAIESAIYQLVLRLR